MSSRSRATVEGLRGAAIVRQAAAISSSARPPSWN
jgi:hypothetical protein